MTAKKRVFLISLTSIGILLILLVYMKGRDRTPESPKNPQLSQEEIEALQALPYADWSEEEADTSAQGVTFHSPEAYDGYNLYTNDADEAYLTDMQGVQKHQWRMPGREHCEYASLMSDGNLLVVCVMDEVLVLDWNSDVIWKRKMKVHHDAEHLHDGSFLVIAQEKPREYRSKTVVFDALVRFSPEGKPLEEWSTYEHLEELKPYHPPSALESERGFETRRWGTQIYDYYHMNTIRTLPDTEIGRKDPRFAAGNWLICLRNADLLLILHKDTREVLWSWGRGVLEFPHSPVMLDNGNILVFDNGTRRKHSRILEIEPHTSRIVWEYRENPPEKFFSPWQGYAQRLPNGNTLICESGNGHVFEVTRDGNIVWEFWNPVMWKEKRKTIYRFQRIPRETVEGRLED